MKDQIRNILVNLEFQTLALDPESTSRAHIDQAEQAISSLINKGRIEARLDELRHVFVSMDDALGSELAEPVAWEYGTVEDRIAQLSALETPTPPSPDSKEES